MTATTTAPEQRTADSDSNSEVFHYVKKDKILSSVVEGGHVVALCGEVFPVRKSPGPGAPVCPDCERIYKQMRSG